MSPPVDTHLSELDLELSLAGELPSAEQTSLEAHVHGCATCRARMDEARALQAELEQLPLPPALAKAPTVPQPANRPLWGALTLVLVAAMALVAIRPGATPEVGDLSDGYRLKGGALSLEVLVDDGHGVRSTSDGAVVHPEDRLGFRYTTGEDGHLLIVGIDATASPYLCAPQDRSGGSLPVPATVDAVALADAVRLDDQLGQEHIVALLCEEPVTFDLVAPELVAAWKRAAGGPLPEVRAGCAQQELRLSKEARP